MKKITFIIYGEPRGKGRPRFRNAGKFIQPYTDEATQCYENLVKVAYHQNYNSIMFAANEMIACDIKAYYSIPKSVSKKKKKLMLEHTIRPTKKPDLDNLQKVIFDGLNKVAFHDDTQIVSITCDKYYDLEPRVEIILQEK